MVETVIVPLIVILTVLFAVLTTVIFMVLLERKVQAWVQVRYGPMRVGYHGLLQTVADVLKLFLKEDITPARADRWLFTIAPLMALVPALIALAGPALFRRPS
nr:NADH-quinone oxidoreductase subunit H [Vicinamibacterales bacterium]